MSQHSRLRPACPNAQSHHNLLSWYTQNMEVHVDENSGQNLDSLSQWIATNACLIVCFVPLRPKSTAMVMAGLSVHLTTLFPGQA